MGNHGRPDMQDSHRGPLDTLADHQAEHLLEIAQALKMLVAHHIASGTSLTHKANPQITSIHPVDH